jgi:hypothetical protein
MRARKAPAVPRKLNAISLMDLRVSVIGTLHDIKGKKGVLEDETARSALVFESDSPVKEGQLVRVFGKPNKGEILVELVQGMDGLEMDLHNRSMEVLE